MNRFLSPLRYPGGKAKFGPFFARLIGHQRVDIDTYCEPYAGGAGAGLHLLAYDHVERIIINDLNPGIVAFWRSLLDETDDFVSLVDSCNVTLDTWHQQREIYESQTGSTIELGFATFFLNRCNRSGILGARPIGGLDQSGPWKLDARFTKANLIKRIALVASYRNRIDVRDQPAIELLSTIGRRKRPVFFYVDPPYMVKGEDLYMRVHSWKDHERLSSKLAALQHPWVLTYGVEDRVRDMYPTSRCLRFGISHTAHKQRVGSELMFFSRGLRVPDTRVVGDRAGEWETRAECSVSVSAR